jgi:hypothetical protein
MLENRNVWICRGEARPYLLRPVFEIDSNNDDDCNKAKQMNLLLRPYDE